MRSISAIFLAGIAVCWGPKASFSFQASRNAVAVPAPVRFSALSSPFLPFPSSNMVHRDPSSPMPPSQRLRGAKRASPSSLGAIPVPTDVLTSFLPPAMGFIKSEWTVSYGYGFATALSAGSLLLKQSPGVWNLASLHAAALVFYGFRLNAFLFLRNRLSPTYRAIGDEIEKKSKERYATRLSRAPFVLSCGLLFYGLYVPVLLTTRLFASNARAVAATPVVAVAAMKVLVGLQWFGYLLAAVGDLTKSYVKGSEKNGKFLVTSGVFSVLRHPNFTGEVLSWTANALCGTLAGAYLLRSGLSPAVLGQLGLSVLGSSGMLFVLLRATSNLEDRQEREHGGTEKYTTWIKNSWCGWKLSLAAPKEKEEAPHEITMNAEVQEDFGSGI